MLVHDSAFAYVYPDLSLLGKPSRYAIYPLINSLFYKSQFEQGLEINFWPIPGKELDYKDLLSI